ncbi:hypothetical protein RchiOBHm_Chr6g0254431 [Rosa chinensis]|uniref:Uncharacterized protein n=1 Tax=Rosa chinensis TaxID=74649 RepID=A0A2P6PLL3_ROSCH|nr:hypothetical protein RchiOBHm_Chr6g0254431 [Rosa chinensis]
MMSVPSPHRSDPREESPWYRRSSPVWISICGRVLSQGLVFCFMRRGHGSVVDHRQWLVLDRGSEGSVVKVGGTE